MFREMRRKKQELDREECEAILARGTSGVLALAGDDGYPYAVPVSYCYADGIIYVHGAVTGHKVDSILHDERVSFCVIDQDVIVPERFTTHYRSVICFGRARIVEDDAERRSALELVGRRFSPGDDEGLAKEVEATMGRVAIIEVTVEHMSGKESIELVRERMAAQADKRA